MLGWSQSVKEGVLLRKHKSLIIKIIVFLVIVVGLKISLDSDKVDSISPQSNPPTFQN